MLMPKLKTFLILFFLALASSAPRMAFCQFIQLRSVNPTLTLTCEGKNSMVPASIAAVVPNCYCCGYSSYQIAQRQDCLENRVATLSGLRDFIKGWYDDLANTKCGMEGQGIPSIDSEGVMISNASIAELENMVSTLINFIKQGQSFITSQINCLQQ